MDEIVVGVDVGTTKICTLVGRVEDAKTIRILGVGIEPSDGIRKGIIVDLSAASQAIKRSVEKAENTSGLEITTALVSLAGAHVSSVNSRGASGIPGGIIDAMDIARALEQAQAVAIPHDREIVHVIQRGITVDGQEGIRTPIGMHGYKLEVETHIITAAAATVDNLRQCVGAAGVEIQQFVLNPLASAEVVLTEQERQMGVAVCDIGGGTTDLAIYVNGDVWHTMVLAVGGNHVTQDIAHGLRLPMAQAEEVKKQQGYAIRSDIASDEYFSIRPFGEDNDVKINRQDLAHIIEARIEETFRLILQEVKRSGYDGLLPAGMVLTGGTSALPGIKQIASEVLGMPVRTAQPENLVGLVDKLGSPAYSTSVGLLRWATTMRDHDVIVTSGNKNRRRSRGESSMNLDSIKNWMKRLLP
ncbi:MAG TPA: cell division protein FtsA [Anaerolineales bacterium]|nr:cell division protein FtsA [Anaerolineales bacterium]HMV94858.1 cell division protein FtsA [Anaerolineales bacterium]HMX17839.1 cell division protein FtsA [Anaerolineales bacterium]HMX72840.1 cell division protein FtsA [Anaerolineales bacterium]HMZ43277.1 cell division protein FtsA [Anaerolineales bacterium]